MRNNIYTKLTHTYCRLPAYFPNSIFNEYALFKTQFFITEGVAK